MSTPLTHTGPTMAARYWTCRKCGYRNERAWLKCRGYATGTSANTAPAAMLACAGRRPPKHVPKHAVALRDLSHAHFAQVNEAIHGQGTNCGVCGAVPKDDRIMQREHDHTTGLARGLACWRCNRLMPKQFDLQTARAIVAYLERVEQYYAGQTD